MSDIGGTNPEHQNLNAIQRGTTRRHFEKLFGFDEEEHAELPVAGSSQPTDHVTSTSRDKAEPFNTEQIRELITNVSSV